MKHSAVAFPDCVCVCFFILIDLYLDCVSLLGMPRLRRNDAGPLAEDTCVFVCFVWTAPRSSEDSSAPSMCALRAETQLKPRERNIIIAPRRKTALSGLLFSKSGYTRVGWARYSIDIYRK